MPISLTAEMVATTAAVVVPVAGLAVAYMRLAMSNSIRGLKLDLIKELNGTYIRSGECALKHSGLADQVDKLERVSRWGGRSTGAAGGRHDTILDRENDS